MVVSCVFVMCSPHCLLISLSLFQLSTCEYFSKFLSLFTAHWTLQGVPVLAKDVLDKCFGFKFSIPSSFSRSLFTCNSVSSLGPETNVQGWFYLQGREPHSSLECMPRSTLVSDLLFAISPSAAWIYSLMQTQTLTLVVFIKCELNFRNNLVRGKQNGTPEHCPLEGILQKHYSPEQCHCVHNGTNLAHALSALTRPTWSVALWQLIGTVRDCTPGIFKRRGTQVL